MQKMHVSMATKRAVNGYLFILPWFVGFLLFYVRSLFMTVQFSLNSLTVPPSGGYELDWVGLGGTQNWGGWSGVASEATPSQGR